MLLTGLGGLGVGVAGVVLELVGYGVTLGVSRDAIHNNPLIELSIGMAM